MTKVFVLGDSRTGTTSLHRFFMDAGLRSVHYFIDEVDEIAKAEGLDKPGFDHFKEFVESSGFDAFSDYPTRDFFDQLLTAYPEAYFILSTRKTPDIWRKSMLKFFQGRTDVEESIEKLTSYYLTINDRIRKAYESAPRFIEVCMEDGSMYNSEKLCKFLNLERKVELLKLNAHT